MALPKEVVDAVARMDASCVDGRVMPCEDAWHSIRAHLLSQDAEIARCKQTLDTTSEGWRLDAGRLAAADALLREIDAHGVLSLGVRAGIAGYLQGAGDAEVTG